MFRHFAKGLTAATMLAAASSPVFADKCMSEAEARADEVRFLQTQLMVAALQCRKVDNGLMSVLYNDFVRNYRTDLVASSQNLKPYLARTGGGKMDAYLVEIANNISLKSASTPDFCSQAIAAASSAADHTPPPELVDRLPVKYARSAPSCDHQTASAQ